MNFCDPYKNKEQLRSIPSAVVKPGKTPKCIIAGTSGLLNGITDAPKLAGQLLYMTKIKSPGRDSNQGAVKSYSVNLSNCSRTPSYLYKCDIDIVLIQLYSLIYICLYQVFNVMHVMVMYINICFRQEHVERTVLKEKKI